MYAGGCSIFNKILASLIVGFIVKLLDDYIDGDMSYINKHSLIDQLGKAILPYSMISFCMAAAVHLEYTVTLMSACYLAGMFHDFNMKLPTGLKAYQESIIILLLNFYIFSIKSMSTSLMVIILIQFIDDLYDMKWDKKYGYKNFANQFGKVEVIIISLIIINILIMLDYMKLLIVILCYLLTQVLYKKIHLKMN